MTLLTAVCGVAADARACPNCVRGLSSPEATRNGDAKLAYNASIGFMLAAPAAVFVGFAAAVWRLSRERDARWEEQRKKRGAGSEASLTTSLGEQP
jgi:hypothetical protein